MTGSTIKKSSPLVIAGAWLFVLLPTLWGLSYTVKNAMMIFTETGPAATQGPTK
jgi:hypothetical protein